MAERDEHQQSSGCSACDQLGQTPTPDHLAGVARFDARQQAARNAESLEAEAARLRERVALLEGALVHRQVVLELDPDGCPECATIAAALTQADETTGGGAG